VWHTIPGGPYDGLRETGLAGASGRP